MRPFLALFFLTSNFIATAQDKPFEISPGWTTGLNKVKVNTISDSSKSRSCILLRKDQELKAYVLDADMKLLKELGTELTENKIIGGFIKDDKLEIFTNSGNAAEVVVDEIEISSGKDNRAVIPLETKGEKYLGVLNGNNSFYYITVSKKIPAFNVYKFTGAENMEKIIFDLKKNGLSKNLYNESLWEELSTAKGISRSADIAIVDPDIECSPDVASSKNKLYLRGDKLVLLTDKEANLLKVFDFDLQNGVASVRTIKRNFEKIDPAVVFKPDFNSFLLGEHLFSVQASSDSLNLLIQDFSTGKILKQYRALDDEAIAFRNTPITQEGGGTLYSMKAERQLEKTKQLLRKMLNGTPVIMAVRNSENQDEITIGAYKKITSGSGAPMMGGAMGTSIAMGMPMGMGMTVGVRASWNRVTRFKMLADANSGEHIPGEMKESVAEQIQKYAEDLKLPDEASSVIPYSNYHRFAYFDKETKKLVVIKFNY